MKVGTYTETLIQDSIWNIGFAWDEKYICFVNKYKGGVNVGALAGWKQSLSRIDSLKSYIHMDGYTQVYNTFGVQIRPANRQFWEKSPWKSFGRCFPCKQSLSPSLYWFAILFSMIMKCFIRSSFCEYIFVWFAASAGDVWQIKPQHSSPRSLCRIYNPPMIRLVEH